MIWPFFLREPIIRLQFIARELDGPPRPSDLRGPLPGLVLVSPFAGRPRVTQKKKNGAPADYDDWLCGRALLFFLFFFFEIGCVEELVNISFRLTITSIESSSSSLVCVSSQAELILSLAIISRPFSSSPIPDQARGNFQPLVEDLRTLLLMQYNNMHSRCVLKG